MNTSDDRVVDLYCTQKLSVAQTAKAINMSPTYVRTVLKRKNVKTRSVSEGRKATTGVTDEQVLELYNQGWAMKKISLHFGKSKNFAENRLNGMGISERRQVGFYNQQRARLDKEQEKSLCDDYENGMLLVDIKKKYGFEGDGTVYDILARHRIELRGQGKNQHGPANPSWKGGISELNIRIRQSPKGRAWRQAVFERDHFTCTLTGEKNKPLNAHHKKRFSEIYSEFLLKHSHLDAILDCEELFNLSQDHEEFWDVDNGVTISEEIHKQLHGE